MKKFTSINSIAMPLDRANIDTDAIIPKQFLKSIKRSGLVQICLMSGATLIMVNLEWITQSVQLIQNLY